MVYAYDYLKHIERVIRNAHYPLVDEYINNLVEDIEDVAQKEEERTMLTQHCMEVLEPGYEYFKKNLLAGDVGMNLPLFKAV